MIQPRYVLIANRLRQRIAAGELRPGDQLPSLDEIAAAWDVSQIVARQAIRMLAIEGLVATRKGTRARVAEQRPLVRVAPHRYRRERGMMTFAAEAETAGVDVDVQHNTVQVAAEADVAERLGIAAGDMVSQTDYLVRMSGQAVSMSRCWEPLDLTAGTEIEWPDDGPYGDLGMVDRFAVIGQHVREIEEALTFRPPTGEEANQLDVSSGMWVVSIAQAFYADERTVEVADIAYRPDRYAAFVYRFPVPPPDSRSDSTDFGDSLGPLP